MAIFNSYFDITRGYVKLQERLSQSSEFLWPQAACPSMAKSCTYFPACLVKVGSRSNRHHVWGPTSLFGKILLKLPDILFQSWFSILGKLGAKSSKLRAWRSYMLSSSPFHRLPSSNLTWLCSAILLILLRCLPQRFPVFKSCIFPLRNATLSPGSQVESMACISVPPFAQTAPSSLADDEHSPGTDDLVGVRWGPVCSAVLQD